MYVFSMMGQCVNLIWKVAVYKTLVVVLAIFVVDTKLIFRYDFVAPLTSEYEKAIIIDRKKSTNDKW